MKKILVLLMCVLTLCSCSSKQEKARRAAEEVLKSVKVENSLTSHNTYNKYKETFSMTKGASVYVLLKIEMEHLYGEVEEIEGKVERDDHITFSYVCRWNEGKTELIRKDIHYFDDRDKESTVELRIEREE